MLNVQLIGTDQEIKKFKKMLHKNYELTSSHATTLGMFRDSTKFADRILVCTFEIEEKELD